MEQPRMMKTTLIFVLMTMLWAGAESQDCRIVIIRLAPCLNYLTGNSLTPSPSCCSQLASVVQSPDQCLCQVLNSNGASLGININETQALALPSACNVETPRCNAVSPPDSPAGTTELPDTIHLAEGGSKSVPSPPEGSSDGSSSHSTKPLIFFTLLITTFVSAMAAN